MHGFFLFNLENLNLFAHVCSISKKQTNETNKQKILPGPQK